MRESHAFERLRERAVLSLLPIGREKKHVLYWLSFFEVEVMAFSWPAVSSASGLGRQHVFFGTSWLIAVWKYSRRQVGKYTFRYV